MEPQVRFKEKSVIIHRDENGFGLRVGGQNPVFVDCVHENGAAWKAGVRKDDRIIKVNGTLVRSFDHQRVVQMIQNCTPFVNLTLHSPESYITEPFNIMQSNESNNSGLLMNPANSNSSNSITSNSMQVHSLHQRLQYPHSVSNNVNWLLEIGDDLFQDNQQKANNSQTQVNNNDINMSSSPTHQQPIGVSKLVVSGPNAVTSFGHPSTSSAGGKLESRHNRNQPVAIDNPYYYYKSAPDRNSDCANASGTTTNNLCNNSTSMLQEQGPTRSSISLSMVRSRSSSKMSTRSVSGKYKPRNLRSRLVEDLRSLTITNSQAAPSSLSTSPSSSDLSDCDDQDPSRLDCVSMDASSQSTSGGLNHSLRPKDNSTQPNRLKVTTRRMEIIRELVDTEKTHTEKLKQLNDLLYKPIKTECMIPADQIKMVFSCHKTLLKIHRQIYKKLAATQQNLSDYVQDPPIGQALLEIFDGDLGKRLEKAASTFCACQSTNAEFLNRITRKDTQVGEFLAQVANQQMLGRLGIKDLLASCFQRLTKYPLLLDNLLKATPAGNSIVHSKSLSEGSIAIPTASAIVSDPTGSVTGSQVEELVSRDGAMLDGTENGGPESKDNNQASTLSATTLIDESAHERLCIERALHMSRQILIHVNEAVNRAIAQNKLKDIWKKTDKNPSLPVIDVETQQLLHEGPLTLRLTRRSFDVYVLLLTHYLVILTREGQDKYKLKYFTADGKSAKQFSPIFNIDEHLATRDTATDENGFYLLCKRKDDSRIYEFASQSPAERAKWKEKIHMAQLYNFAAVPEDDNTLTRYRELISLAASNNTPNNVEQSPLNNNIIAAHTSQES